MFNSEVRASNTFTSSSTVTVNAGGCDYVVQISFTCAPYAGIPIPYLVDSYYLVDPSCTTTLSENEIANAISNKIAEDPSWNLIDCSSSYPPCSGQYRGVWTQIEANCMYKKTYVTAHGLRTVVLVCHDEGYCETDWEYCFNGVDVIGTPVNWVASAWNCDTIVPPNPPSGSSSTCFKVVTNCD